MTVTSAPRHGGRAADHRQATLIAVLTAAVVCLATIVGVLLARGGTSPGSGLQGSGVAASQARAVAAFGSLDLAGANNVTVAVGRPQSVVVGSGLIQVAATASLDAAVPGTGAIYYTGSPPQVTTSITGTGAVIHG